MIITRKDRPKALAIAFLLFGSMLLSMVGLFTDFIPQHHVKWVGSSIAICLVIITIIWGKGLNVINAPSSNLLIKIIYPVMGVGLLFYCYWLTTVYAIPAVYTRMSGTPYQIIENVDPVYQPATKECDYKIRNEHLKGTARGFVCINKSWYELNEHKYLIYGYQSALGFYIRGTVPFDDFMRHMRTLSKDTVVPR